MSDYDEPAFDALVLPADLTVAPWVTQIHNYRDIQAIVGGTFDVTRTELDTVKADGGHRFELSLFVHDEGLLIGLPENVIATFIGHRRLVGNAVVTGPADLDGNTTSISRDAATTVLAADGQLRRLLRYYPYNQDDPTEPAFWRAYVQAVAWAQPDIYEQRMKEAVESLIAKIADTWR